MILTEQHHRHNYMYGMLNDMAQYMVDPSVSGSHFDFLRHTTVSYRRLFKIVTLSLIISLSVTPLEACL